MKYRFINEHRQQYSLSAMCRVLRVARSGFYEWLHRPQCERAIENERLLGLIRDSYAASSDAYGSPRVFGDLRETGETCGRHRVARLIRAQQIKVFDYIEAFYNRTRRHGHLGGVSPEAFERAAA